MLGWGRLHGEAVLPLCLWCAKPDQECYVPSMHSTVQSSTAAGITLTHCQASSVTLAAAALTQSVVTRLHVFVPFASGCSGSPVFTQGIAYPLPVEGSPAGELSSSQYAVISLVLAQAIVTAVCFNVEILVLH